MSVGPVQAQFGPVCVPRSKPKIGCISGWTRRSNPLLVVSTPENGPDARQDVGFPRPGAHLVACWGVWARTCPPKMGHGSKIGGFFLKSDPWPLSVPVDVFLAHIEVSFVRFDSLHVPAVFGTQKG